MKSELEYVLKELAQYVIYGEEKLKNVYQKEKITKLDSTNMNDINKIYKKFQKIEEDNYWRMQEDEIFYKQAKYLEDFEDDYEINQMYRNSYFSYKNSYTYESFSFKDFRTYFSWRTKIRKGIFEKIDWEYDQIYINELLNKIGCKDADDAIEKLICFWKGYRKCKLIVDKIMPNIIKQFYIINDINTPYQEIVEKYPIKLKTSSKDIKEIKKGIYTDKIEFLNEISTYKIEKSKLLETKYGYILNECIEKVFLKLHKEFEKSNIILPDMLVHKNMTENWWRPLASYNIYQMEKMKKEIIIEGTEKYECKGETWSRTIYTSQSKYKNTIGYILKTMECYIREYLGYRKLKLPEKKEVLEDIYSYYCTNKEKEMLQKIYNMDLQQIIQLETLQYLQNTKIPKMTFKKKKEDTFEQEEKIEVVFNQEQFAKIREKSEEIQKALIIEEQPIEEKIEIKEVAKTIIEIPQREEDTNTHVFKTFVYNLTQTEKEMIQVLLQKQDVENKILQIAQKQNEMLEVMVSNINDKALEMIGDTIIESDMTAIYEDYENEIKQVL